jgi:hypothetical protein
MSLSLRSDCCCRRSTKMNSKFGVDRFLIRSECHLVIVCWLFLSIISRLNLVSTLFTYFEIESLQIRTRISSRTQRGWPKIMDFSPRWKWYKMKVLDEYRTALMSVSLDLVPFVDKNLRNVMSMSCRTPDFRKIVFSNFDLKLYAYRDLK